MQVKILSDLMENVMIALTVSAVVSGNDSSITRTAYQTTFEADKFRESRWLIAHSGTQSSNIPPNC